VRTVNRRCVCAASRLSHLVGGKPTAQSSDPVLEVVG
jgi:hypothetical protein